MIMIFADRVRDHQGFRWVMAVARQAVIWSAVFRRGSGTRWRWWQHTIEA